jgi:hypothetical protein
MPFVKECKQYTQIKFFIENGNEKNWKERVNGTKLFSISGGTYRVISLDCFGKKRFSRN